MHPIRQPRDAVRALGLAILATSVAVWWFCMLHVPATRPWFFPDGHIEHALRSFVMPDLIVMAGGSMLAAWLIYTGRPGAAAAAWFTAGATCYAAVYTIAWALHEDVPVASPLAMLAAAGLSLLCARRPVPRSR